MPKRKPKPKPTPKPTPKCAKRCAPKKLRRLSPQELTLLIDRMEAAARNGPIVLNAEDMRCDALDLTRAEVELLFCVLLGIEREQSEALTELREALAERKGTAAALRPGKAACVAQEGRGRAM